MREVDGADGGGQVVRSALALAGVTGEAVRVENVRGARPDPGLQAQHLAAVAAVATACDASVTGARPGSETLTFEPRSPRGGRFGVDVGTAGSVALVCEALLPLALALDAPLAVAVRGGTDVQWAPTLAHYRRAKLPLLRAAGLDATLAVERRGFYPAGRGVVTLTLWPAACAPLGLADRGEPGGAGVYSVASADLAGAEVAERQAAAAVDRLAAAGVDVTERRVASVPASSTGSAVAVVRGYERGRAGFDALGERGKPAERVGREAAEAAVEFDDEFDDEVGGDTESGAGGGAGGAGGADGDELRGDAPAVDEHTADQLVPFLALAGGRVRVPRVTDHVATNCEVARAFGFDVRVEAEAASTGSALLVGE